MRRSVRLICWVLWVVAVPRVFAGDPGATQTTATDGHPYSSPLPVNDPFPDSYYGADHGGSTLTLAYPFLSPFGFTDHSRGQFVYNVAPFTPRGSEGVFGMDVWLEQQDGSGNWNAASLNGGVSDQGVIYQPINTPNPGPSPGYTFTWTYDGTTLPPNTNFRIFVYVYLYNQGGGSAGYYPVYSATAPVATGAANDAPRIAWTASSGALNPTQAVAGQTYTISADGQDDNGNLVAVSINKNGQPFAYAGGGNGYSGNSQNPSSDPIGSVTYTAWATDSYGAQSPTLTWTVNVTGKWNQAPVSSSSATMTFGTQPFTPDYFGGSGTGSWQFCIADYTNWTGAADANAGTELSPSNVWSPSWLPPAPGTYYFWVAKDGDGSYNPSGAAGLYPLTVTPAPPVGSFDGVAPSSVTLGQTITGSGWAADAQMGAPLSSVLILVDGGAGGSASATLGESRPDVQSANASWGQWSPHDITDSGWSFSFNASGLSLGGHTFTAIATDNAYGVSASIGSQSFTVLAPIPVVFSAAPTSFTYNGSPQGPVVSSSPSGATYALSGVASATGAGSYAFTVTASGAYAGASTIDWSIAPAGQAAVTVSPASASTLTGQGVAFTASGGSGGGAYLWGGAAAGAGPTVTVTPAAPGVYSITVYKAGDANYAASAPATAALTVAAPLQTQTIVFTPPPSVTLSGTSLALTASASSGLPVSFVVVSGPGVLSGDQLTFTGVGSVVVQAAQGGNGQWLAAPPVSSAIVVNAPFPITRVRFNANGRDARVSGPGSPGGAAMIWTDPAGLQASPWPSFTNPQPLTPATGSFPLPAPEN